MKQTIQLTTNIPANYKLSVDKVYETTGSDIIAIFKTEKINDQVMEAQEMTASVDVEVMGGPLPVSYAVITDLKLEEQGFFVVEDMRCIHLGYHPECLYNASANPDGPALIKSATDNKIERLFAAIEALKSENKELRQQVAELSLAHDELKARIDKQDSTVGEAPTQRFF